MADTPQKPKPPGGSREARLADALRANLRRRKAAGDDPPADGEPDKRS